MTLLTTHNFFDFLKNHFFSTLGFLKFLNCLERCTILMMLESDWSLKRVVSLPASNLDVYSDWLIDVNSDAGQVAEDYLKHHNFCLISSFLIL